MHEICATLTGLLCDVTGDLNSSFTVGFNGEQLVAVVAKDLMLRESFPKCYCVISPRLMSSASPSLTMNYEHYASC